MNASSQLLRAHSNFSSFAISTKMIFPLLKKVLADFCRTLQLVVLKLCFSIFIYVKPSWINCFCCFYREQNIKLKTKWNA